MPSFSEANDRQSDYYQSLLNDKNRDFERLDYEFAQIQVAYAWLSNRSSEEEKARLLEFIKNFAPYLKARMLHRVLLEYCQDGLRASKDLNANPGWLLVYAHEVYWAIGEWEKALSNIQNAIEATKDVDPIIYAQATLALGHLQFNRGEYRTAFHTLKMAEELLGKISDIDGVAAVKSETAAYHLNKGEYQKALEIYLEVDKLRREVDPSGPSDHTLLMLGVVHRRLKNYDKAIEYLSQLMMRGQATKNLNALATAMHHLAWVYYDKKDWNKARELGVQAKEIYERISDPRGSSDEDEQLGLICLAEKSYSIAEDFLQRSLEVRNQLGNQQGSASSLRRLAKLYFSRRKFTLSIHCLWRSLLLYRKLGVLSLQRAIKMIIDVIQ